MSSLKLTPQSLEIGRNAYSTKAEEITIADFRGDREMQQVNLALMIS